MNKNNIWWKSIHINMNFCNDNIKNTKKIEEFINELCIKIKMNKYWPLYLERFWYWDLEWYSCMQFIETSSITCHFDEQNWKNNRAFIDIFSCKDFNSEITEKFCSEYFQAKELKSTTLDRK